MSTIQHIVSKTFIFTFQAHNTCVSIAQRYGINKIYVYFQLEFKTDDVVVPDVPGMFTTMHAKGTPLFIEARHFTDPLHYAKIMGYDKPMDFKLGEQDSSDNQKQ